MFWPDIPSLNAFYNSACGQATFAHISRALDDFWPDTHDETIAGLGFSAIYLPRFMKRHNKVIALMPSPQGSITWPSKEHNLCCMTDEGALPLPDNSIDRMLLVHILEYSDQSPAMMREIWRVLKPCGKLLVVMPNRLGLWSHMERTPFGHGHPFNIMQISNLLQEAMFTPTGTISALFMPPVSVPFLASSVLFETIGKHCLQPFGGVLITAAEKHVYAPVGMKEKSLGEKIRTYVMPGAPEPVAG